MKRLAVLLVFVFAATIFAAAAEDKAAGNEMTGWVCNAKCVKQDAGKATCDTSCAEKSGDVVFVDDQGKTIKIANQKMAKSHAGKQVKMKGKMKGEMMQVEGVYDFTQNPG